MCRPYGIVSPNGFTYTTDPGQVLYRLRLESRILFKSSNSFGRTLIPQPLWHRRDLAGYVSEGQLIGMAPPFGLLGEKTQPFHLYYVRSRFAMCE